MPDHHDGLARQLGGEEVALLGDLALVSYIEPCVAENSVQLGPEYLRVIVDAAVNRFRPDEITIVHAVRIGLHQGRTVQKNVQSDRMPRDTAGPGRTTIARRKSIVKTYLQYR